MTAGVTGAKDRADAGTGSDVGTCETLDPGTIAARAAREAADAFSRLADSPTTLDAIARAGALLSRCLREGGKVIACGNGGSMSDAIHLAEELTGRFRADRRALAAIALSDPGHLTCVGNDLGYDEVFSRGVEALGRAGDVLVAFTTSGTSRNVLRAVDAAQQAGMDVVAITGRTGSPVEAGATVAVVTPGGRWADRVQEMHTLVLHTLIEIVETTLGLRDDS
ncbi:MAG: D-sedoheptulose-7-phosphate isomerase [Acidimicrobiales bacterium]